MSDESELHELRAEVARLRAIVNTPEANDFIRGVSIEAEHQRQRWGEAHDRNKTPPDWFWLVGYLAGKALQATSIEKQKHHTISTAAVLMQWHASIVAGERTGAWHDPSKPSDLELYVAAKTPGVVQGDGP